MITKTNPMMNQRILILGLLLVIFPVLFSLFLVWQLSYNIDDLRRGIALQMKIEQVGENIKDFALIKKLDQKNEMMSVAEVNRLKDVNDHFFKTLEETYTLDTKEREYLTILENQWESLKTNPASITSSHFNIVNEYDNLLINHEKLKMSHHEPKIIKTISTLLAIMSIIALLALIITIYAVYLILRDNDFKKQLLLELTDSREKALTASRMKSKFLAIVSHELRTPLNGIIGMSDIMRRNLEHSDHKDQINIIHNSGKTLMRIINDILDFSKIESNQILFEFSDFDIRSVITQVVDTLSYKAKTKNLILGYEIDPTLPHSVIGDGDRLAQILFNLIGNALKFTEAGYIDIKVHLLSHLQEVYEVAFVIQDSGIGMSDGEVESLFTPFTQFQKEGTSGEAGTGLGLSITKTIVTAMGGEIQVQSQKGLGTKFTIVIPFKASQTSINADSQSRVEFSCDEQEFRFNQKLQVLIAEDNTTNQIIAQSLLSRMGADVTTAENGLEVLNFCDNQKYDLIFMDCQMPKMDGYEATIELRKRGNATPIIAMTANATEKDKDLCRKAGMNGFVSKPILLKTVFEETQRVLSGYRQTLKLETLNRLHHQIGGEAIQKVLQSFKLSLLDFEEQVTRALELQDGNTLRKKAHKLKSSSVMVGAEEFASSCEQMENSESTEDLARATRNALNEISALSLALENFKYDDKQENK